MFERIGSFFRGRMLPSDSAEGIASSHEVRLASCALLLELAYADNAFTADEHEHIENAVRRHFGLDHDQAEELLLMADWQRRLDGNVGTFARLIADHYSIGQKMVLAEVMWGLVRSDGSLAPREEALMTRVNALLGFKPGYLAGQGSDDGEERPRLSID
jgi:uncharacterized tellurite resistance protein B-like protein